jgi:hypothetical protein
MIHENVSATLLLVCASCMAVAQPGPRGGPPQEAIDACSGVSLEQACQFESPHGELNGTCREVRDGNVACVPERGSRGGGRNCGDKKGLTRSGRVSDDPWLRFLTHQFDSSHFLHDFSFSAPPIQPPV